MREVQREGVAIEDNNALTKLLERHPNLRDQLGAMQRQDQIDVRETADLPFDGDSFAARVLTRFRPALQIEKFARVVAILNWVRDQEGVPFPGLPEEVRDKAAVLAIDPTLTMNDVIDELRPPPTGVVPSRRDSQANVPTGVEALVPAAQRGWVDSLRDFTAVAALTIAAVLLMRWLRARGPTVTSETSNQPTHDPSPPPAKPTEARNSSLTLTCRICGAKQPMPRNRGDVRVSCPTCGRQWEVTIIY